FIALPGGTGTLEEIVEVFVWGQLGLHQNSCGFLDVDGYYSHFLKFLDGMAEERFLREDHLRQLLVGTVAGELVERVLSNRFEAIDKWLDREG
ncbi:MAG: LOG family protein, partial [Verrucomicrobiota bacterium]